MSTQLPNAFVGALAALVVLGLVVTPGLVLVMGLVIRKVRPTVEEQAVLAAHSTQG